MTLHNNFCKSGGAYIRGWAYFREITVYTRVLVTVSSSYCVSHLEGLAIRYHFFVIANCLERSAYDSDSSDPVEFILVHEVTCAEMFLNTDSACET